MLKNLLKGKDKDNSILEALNCSQAVISFKPDGTELYRNLQV